MLAMSSLSGESSSEKKIRAACVSCISNSDNFIMERASRKTETLAISFNSSPLVGSVFLRKVGTKTFVKGGQKVLRAGFP